MQGFPHPAFHQQLPESLIRRFPFPTFVGDKGDGPDGKDGQDQDFDPGDVATFAEQRQLIGNAMHLAAAEVWISWNFVITIKARTHVAA